MDNKKLSIKLSTIPKRRVLILPQYHAGNKKNQLQQKTIRGLKNHENIRKKCFIKTACTTL